MVRGTELLKSYRRNMGRHVSRAQFYAMVACTLVLLEEEAVACDSINERKVESWQ